MNAIDIKYILYDIDASTEEKGVFRFLHKWNYTIEKFLSDWDRNGWYLYATNALKAINAKIGDMDMSKVEETNLYGQVKNMKEKLKTELENALKTLE